jgi:hypothetical protein
MRDNKKNIGNTWQRIEIMEHQKKAPKPTTHHENQKELWNDSTNHPNHGNLRTPEILPTHDEGQEEYWDQLGNSSKSWKPRRLGNYVHMMKTKRTCALSKSWKLLLVMKRPRRRTLENIT